MLTAATSNPSGLRRLHRLINFAVGVVNRHPYGIFSSGQTGHASPGIAGGVIGQTFALEGMFAFFLESTFLGLLGALELSLNLGVNQWESGSFGEKRRSG